MTRLLDWHPVAIRDLQEIHWKTAARIDAAVMLFAKTGEGNIERIPTDPRRIRLRARGAVALLYLTPEIIYVGRVFRAG